MAYIQNVQTNTGSFVPTTAAFDVTALYSVDVTSPEFKELLVRLYQHANTLALSLNTKRTSYFIQEEFNTSGLYFNPNDPSLLNLRPNYCFTKDIGPLPLGLTAIPHGITTQPSWKVTTIYGGATRIAPRAYYPLPYPSATGANNISVDIDDTNINIVNNSGIVFDSSTVVWEYVKF